MDLDNYVPERTREKKVRKKQNIKGKSYTEQKAAFDELFKTIPSEPYSDMNRLTEAMTIWKMEMEVQFEYPEECRGLEPEQEKMLAEIEHDIETYLDNWNLTWRNKYWEKREFLRKLSS